MNAKVPHDAFVPALGARHIESQWDQDLVEQISRYIQVPAKSPLFDPQWEVNGYIDHVVRQAADWVVAQKIPGLILEVIRLPGRTPVLFFEVASTQVGGTTDTMLMYGHLDKQPEFSGWRNDLGPWTPKRVGDKLYGRGGADDGYAIYAAVAAIAALKAQNTSHARIVGLVETSEESGSNDLTAYLDVLKPRLGEVGLVICLDSGAGNYDQLWLTTSLRGMVSATLKVQVLTEGVHSGDASGVVPSSFRILRQVLDRLEDSKTGRLLPESLHCNIPESRMAQARVTAGILGDELFKRFPWAHADCDGASGFVLPTTTDPLEALLRRTWHPTLSVTGVDGMPSLKDAGNVLRPYTAFKLSLRLPPTLDAVQAMQTVQALVQDNAPYQAIVTMENVAGASGWNAPESATWFDSAVNAASMANFGAPCGYIGQGGTIPLMNMLSQGFPKAQMMVCGVLGPQSNAHGPNEFLHIPYAKKLTNAVAQVMAAFE